MKTAAARIYNRITRVVCDHCRAEHYLSTGRAGTRPPTECEWDDMLIVQMQLAGWRCGVHPTNAQRHAPRDICPDCRAKGHR